MNMYIDILYIDILYMCIECRMTFRLKGEPGIPLYSGIKKS